MNKKWYSTIIVIIIIWFMILLTTWVFRLVLSEMKDNRALWNYIKSYAWAESAQEIALLDIKEKSYGFNWTLSWSEILDKTDFNPNKTATISYFQDWKTQSYSGTIDWFKYNVLPLFYIDRETEIEKKVNSINISVTSWISSDLAWNIISEKEGISWIWDNFTEWKWLSSNIKLNIYNVNTFLSNSKSNYLILFNNSDNSISYTIQSFWNEFFTKPEIDIISSAKLGWFKQNIKTHIKYADIVNKSKYSIYSK